MLNPLPSIAVLPLAILWFGLSTTALIVVIANAVIWPIAINVEPGFRTANPTVVAVGRNIGLSGWRLVRDVLMPAALPHTISGLKTGWAFGWRTIIAAELVFGVAGSGGGLGNFINDARYFLRTPDVFAGLVTIIDDRHRPRPGCSPGSSAGRSSVGHEGAVLTGASRQARRLPTDLRTTLNARGAPCVTTRPFRRLTAALAAGTMAVSLAAAAEAQRRGAHLRGHDRLPARPGLRPAADRQGERQPRGGAGGRRGRLAGRSTPARPSATA